MTSAFVSYSHKDEDLRDQLEIHLAALKREGAIDLWHDRRIPAGEEFDHHINQNLEQADVILLLVSPDFLASPYCNDVEVHRAMQRHAEGSARVIPIILRPCDWKRMPFGKLTATPRDGKPITKWPDRDEAFLEVVTAIRQALPSKKDVAKPTSHSMTAHVSPETKGHEPPRSSNLRIRKKFSDADQDRFLDESFEFIARFFENSLDELQARNSGIESSFKRVSTDQFSSSVYRNGKAEARCRIRLGGRRSATGDITFSYNDDGVGHSYNEALSVVVGEHELFLRALGMGRVHGAPRPDHLSQEGAGEYLWAMFIEPLQR